MFDLASFLAGLQAFGRALMPLLAAVAAVIGLYCIGRAIYSLVRPEPGQDVKLGSVAMQTVVGALLLQAAVTSNWARGLLGGAGSGMREHLAVGGVAPTGSILHQIVSVGLLWVAVIGFVGVITGLVLWIDAAKGNTSGPGGRDAFWGGFWRIVGGGLAINIGL